MPLIKIFSMLASGCAFSLVLAFWFWACIRFMRYTEGLPETGAKQAAMLKIIFDIKILGFVTASAGAFLVAAK